MPSRPQAKSTRSLPRDKNPYIVCSSSWNLQTERVWCVIWKLSSHITFHTSQGITRIISYNKLPHSKKAPYSFTNVGNLPTPMTHGMAMPTLPVGWGLDHPDTLTFEHNLAAPWLGPETWDLVGTPGSSKVSYMEETPKQSGSGDIFFPFPDFGVVLVFFFSSICFFRISCPKLGVLKKNLSISFV